MSQRSTINSMNEKESAPPQSTFSTANGFRWPAYLGVTVISGASAYVSFFMAVFSINETVISLSVLFSVFCFISALILVFNRRIGPAFLLSLAIVPLFFCLSLVYYQTRPIQIEVGNSVAEVSRLVAEKIRDPQPALDRAIQEGSIRRATDEDVRAFRDAYFEKKYVRQNLPVPATEDALSVTKVDLSRAYVVLKKFTESPRNP